MSESVRISFVIRLLVCSYRYFIHVRGYTQLSSVTEQTEPTFRLIGLSRARSTCERRNISAHDGAVLYGAGLFQFCWSDHHTAGPLSTKCFVLLREQGRAIGRL